MHTGNAQPDVSLWVVQIPHLNLSGSHCNGIFSVCCDNIFSNLFVSF